VSLADTIMAWHYEAMTDMNEIPGYLSYSSFSTYQSCNWEYYLTRVLQVETAPAIWFPAGTAVHAATDAIDHILIKEGK
jgi:ATP-dependent helicase/DNAse subunit B